MPDKAATSATIARMRARLEQVLAPLQLDIEDESAAHAGHAGARSGGGHYRVYLISERFAGLPRVARHRLVYDALQDLMQREIHALALSVVTPDEAGGTHSATTSGIQGS
jgi:BolA protein